MMEGECQTKEKKEKTSIEPLMCEKIRKWNRMERNQFPHENLIRKGKEKYDTEQDQERLCNLFPAMQCFLNSRKV